MGIAVSTPYGRGVTLYDTERVVARGEVELWYAVVELAIRDARYLATLPEDENFLTKRQRWMVSQMVPDPFIFLDSEFCRDLCRALDVALPEDIEGMVAAPAEGVTEGRMIWASASR